jgi:hypothetical protein
LCSEPPSDQFVGEVQQIFFVFEVGQKFISLRVEELIIRMKRPVILDKIQPQADVVYPDQIGDMTDVVDQFIQRGVFVCDLSRDSIDSHDAAGLGQGLDLIIIDIARMKIQFPTIGVAAADRALRHIKDVEKPAREI